MLTKAIKWTAIAALIGSAYSHSLPDMGPVLQFAIAASAVIVLTQAATMRRYVWMSLFFLAACLFNPIVHVPFSNHITGILTGLVVLLFFFSLELLQPKPQAVERLDHVSHARERGAMKLARSQSGVSNP